MQGHAESLAWWWRITNKTVWPWRDPSKVPEFFVTMYEAQTHQLQFVIQKNYVTPVNYI